MGNTSCCGRGTWLQLSQSCASGAEGKEDFLLLCMTCVACAVTYLVAWLMLSQMRGSTRGYTQLYFLHKLRAPPLPLY